MSLSSTSTLANAKAQLADNLDWLGSVSKAKLYREAALWMLHNKPERLDTQLVKTQYAQYESQLTQVDAFLKAADSTTRGVSFVRGRMPRA